MHFKVLIWQRRIPIKRDSETSKTETRGKEKEVARKTVPGCFLIVLFVWEFSIGDPVTFGHQYRLPDLFCSLVPAQFHYIPQIPQDPSLSSVVSHWQLSNQCRNFLNPVFLSQSVLDCALLLFVHWQSLETLKPSQLTANVQRRVLDLYMDNPDLTHSTTYASQSPPGVFSEHKARIKPEHCQMRP